MFLKADLTTYIRVDQLDQLAGFDDGTIQLAIDTATAEITDYLTELYDMPAVLALTGNARPKQLMRWIADVTLYILYKAIPDNRTPERVIDDYDKVITKLTSICDGRMSTQLPRRVNADNEPKTRFRWGSDPRRN